MDNPSTSGIQRGRCVIVLLLAPEALYRGGVHLDRHTGAVVVKKVGRLMLNYPAALYSYRSKFAAES